MSENDEFASQYKRVLGTMSQLMEGESPSREDFVESMANIAVLFNRRETQYGLQDDEEALAGRLVWVFPTGHVFWYSEDDDTCIFSHMTEEYDEDSELPETIHELFSDIDEEMEFQHYCNGWEMNSPDDMSAAVASLESELGEAKMLIPLAHVVEFNIPSFMEEDDPGGEFLEYLGIDESDEDEYKVQAARKLLQFLSKTREDGTIASSSDLWNASLVNGNEGMPKYSGTERFKSFLNDLEEKKGWLVMRNQCCASCAGSYRKTLLDEDPEKEGAPEFITWGQQSQLYWGNRGSVSHQTDVESEHVDTLFEIADENGLDLQTEETEGDLVTVTVLARDDEKDSFHYGKFL